MTTLINDSRPINKDKQNELLSKLNWTVSKVPLVAANDILTTTKYFAVQRDDTRELFTTCSDQYTPFQNDLFIELVQKFAENTNSEIQQVNVLKGGAKINAILETEVINKSFAKVNDKVAVRLIVSNSHDATKGLNVSLKHVFLVCTNGMVRTDKKGSFSIRHTASMNDKLKTFLNGKENLINTSNLMLDQYSKLEEVKLLPKHVDTVLELMTGFKATDIKEGRVKTRGQNIVNNLMGSVTSEMSYRGENLLGLFNGVTHYTTHGILNGATDAKTVSYLQGATAAKVQNVFDYCISLCN